MARPSREKLAVALACRKATAWKVPSGLNATQLIAGQFLNLVCMLYNNYGMYGRRGHIVLGSDPVETVVEGRG